MIAFLIGTTIIGVIIIIVMKKCRLAAFGARRIFVRALFFMSVGCKSMFTNRALIFLITKFIFAVFIEFFGVAFWATIWYNFIHEILSPFSDFQGGIGFVVKLLYHKEFKVSTFI